MKIRITAGGIHGVDGEIAIGTELTVKDEPTGWHGRYVVLADAAEGAAPVTNDDPLIALRAEYEALAGASADKRWSEDTLREKIKAAKEV